MGAGADAVQPVDAGAAEQVEEECLDRVVAVVGCRNSSKAQGVCE